MDRSFEIVAAKLKALVQGGMSEIGRCMPLPRLAVSPYPSECVDEGSNRKNHTYGKSKANARPRCSFACIEPESKK
jgi:hypothetical protein